MSLVVPGTQSAGQLSPLSHVQFSTFPSLGSAAHLTDLSWRDCGEGPSTMGPKRLSSQESPLRVGVRLFSDSGIARECSMAAILCLDLSIFWHFIFIKNTKFSLAHVAQWIECWPANQRVASLIPSQGTCPGCGPGPQQGARERQPVDVSLIPLTRRCFCPSLSPSIALCLKNK